MESDLWGNTKPTPIRCGHMNAEYVLHLQGSVKVRSTYSPGVDKVEEVGRSIYWGSGVQGKCLDCGKSLWYGYSSIPKFVLRRLTKVTVPGPDGEDLLRRIKEGR